MSPKKSPKKSTAKTRTAPTTGPAERATKAKPTKAKAARPIEKKASRSAPSTRKPAKRQTAERLTVGGLRTLGDVAPGEREKPKSPKPTADTRRAHEILTQEFERALSLKEKLAAESAIGGQEKGREATRQREKLRAIVNSLEGMNRFAMQMGLVTPAEARELYAQAMQRGLYEGWR